jgi:PRC-barrel domain
VRGTAKGNLSYQAISESSGEAEYKRTINENEIMTTTQQAQSTLLAAAEIKGTTVQNLQNEDIGDVDELLIRHQDGVVRLAVLSVGGFLGLGSTRVAVPWTAFDIATLRDGTIRITLDATREQLEKAPRTEGKNYQRLYTGEVVEPIFNYWEIEYVD